MRGEIILRFNKRVGRNFYKNVLICRQFLGDFFFKLKTIKRMKYIKTMPY